MPTLGNTIRDLNERSGCGADPMMEILCTRNLLLSNGSISPKKSTAPRSCWITSVSVHSLGSERLAQSPRRCYDAGGIRTQSHGKTTHLPHVFPRCVSRAASTRPWRHRPAPVVLHRRRGPMCRPLPAQAGAPGLPGATARGLDFHFAGRPYTDSNTLCRSVCMIEYYRSVDSGDHTRLTGSPPPRACRLFRSLGHSSEYSPRSPIRSTRITSSLFSSS